MENSLSVNQGCAGTQPKKKPNNAMDVCKIEWDTHLILETEYDHI
jgi:hypothetical protein